MPSPDPRKRILVAGGGVAGAEAVLALHALAEDFVDVTLLAPEPDLVVRAMAPARAFGVARAQRVPLARLAAATGTTIVRDRLASVDPAARTARLAGGDELPYDALLIATGAGAAPAVPYALQYDPDAPDEIVGGLRADLEEGWAGSVAFVVPTGPGWPLPAYELAALTAGAVRGMGRDGAEVLLVTPESSPLGMFGPAASAGVARELEDAGVRWVTYRSLNVRRGHRVFLGLDGGRELAVERLVALPRAAGRPVGGVPMTPGGFVPVDATCRVPGLDGVWAAGDGTASALKQGGLAAQQAAAAARGIAAEAGAAVDVRPLRPVLRAVLVTPAGPRWLHRDLGRDDTGRIADAPLWEPHGKIAGAHVAAFLAAHPDTAPEVLSGQARPRRFPRVEATESLAQG